MPPLFIYFFFLFLFLLFFFSSPFVSQATTVFLVVSSSFIACLGPLGLRSLRCTGGSEPFSPSCFLRPGPLPPPEAKIPRRAGGEA